MTRAVDLPRRDPARRPHRRRGLFALLAVAGSLLGLRLLSRRRGRRPMLPPQGWGRSHHYLWRGDEVHFQQLGDGTPVVLVHSLGPGHSSSEWHRTAELLADSLALMAPDLPGWGRSSAALVEPRPRLYVDFLADFLSEVVRRPAVLVAAGGAAPYAVAAATALGKERVRGLGLVTPHGLGDRAPGTVQQLLGRAADVPLLGSLAAQGLTTRRAIRQHLERDVFAAAPERADAARQEAWYRAARRPGARRALLRHLAGGLAFDVSELLSHLTMPVWLSWGRGAPDPSVEAADLWLQRLPEADLDVFEGAGALPHLEVPVAFARKLQLFLARLPA
jgi:pimeloyl-ACP methyl ester carboxylesterase